MLPTRSRTGGAEPGPYGVGRSRSAPSRHRRAMERSTATGLYPRLSLGIGQRFASKTGYLVRFDEAGAFVAIGERTSP